VFNFWNSRGICLLIMEYLETIYEMKYHRVK
jgi:hypothetical protein